MNEDIKITINHSLFMALSIIIMYIALPLETWKYGLLVFFVVGLNGLKYLAQMGNRK